MSNQLIICRCETVSADRVEQAIVDFGCTDANSVKKLTRAGMGYCQGKVCMTLVQRALHRLVGPEAADTPLLCRPPVRAVPLEQLARACPDDQAKPRRVGGLMLFADKRS